MKLSEKKELKKKKHSIIKKKLSRYFNFFMGCLLVAIAYNLFLASNNLVPGGVSGLAVVLNYLFGINNALFVFIVGIFLLILSYFLLGKEKTRYSVLGTLLFPVFMELTVNINKIIPMDTSQLLLSSIFGGVIYGFGIGMIFKAGFTTGGTDIVNQILSKYLKLSIGQSMLITDGLIVTFSAIVFGPIHLMYSILVLYIISIMSDRVILGISDSKAFFIVTEKDEEVKEYVLNVLGHGATIFKAKGALNKENQNVIMCVLPTKEYYKLKAGINEIDKEAFFVATDAYEVFGGE